MHSGEVIESQHIFKVFLHADGRLCKFCLIAFNEQVKGLLYIDFGFYLLDFMQCLFGPCLFCFRQIVKYIAAFMNTTVLGPCLGTNLF